RPDAHVRLTAPEGVLAVSAVVDVDAAFEHEQSAQAATQIFLALEADARSRLAAGLHARQRLRAVRGFDVRVDDAVERKLDVRFRMGRGGGGDRKACECDGASLHDEPAMAWLF